ncbi:MAG: MFS transporter, partial [Bacteroidetes bacterium]|nr:MFS transporter [Bacteroidota bacterium]
SVAFYKNAYNILAIVSLPFFGRLLGRLDPRKFAVITFFSMMGYLMFLMITEYFPQSVEFEGIRLYFTMAGYILFHSVFAATMSLLWSIGSAYFCEKEEAGLYQGVHLSLTGVRAIFAPLMGVVFYELWGFTTAFLIAAGFLLCGIAIMVWSYKRDRG